MRLIVQERSFPRHLPIPRQRAQHRDGQDPSRRSLLRRRQRVSEHSQAGQYLDLDPVGRDDHDSHWSGGTRLPGDAEPGVCANGRRGVQGPAQTVAYHQAEGGVGEGWRVPVGTGYFGGEGEVISHSNPSIDRSIVEIMHIT